MNTGLKVMVVVGTRPEIIRLARVLARLHRHTELVLVHTGQNYDYELNEIFFRELQIPKPQYILDAAGANAVQTIGNMLIRIDPILEREKPDAFVILGDTNSCLTAIAAKKRKIPIFHMEAGNRCFDQRVPEETNRVLVDHLSDINLTYSDHARRFLLAEGLPADRVIKTGSPLYEVMHHYQTEIGRSHILRQMHLEPARYLLLSAHREENIEPPGHIHHLADVINTLAEEYAVPVVVSAHPRTRRRCRESKTVFHENVIISKPFGYFDYMALQQHARIVLSDSGTITEEASILGFPAINIRDTHERHEGMDAASVIMTGLDKGRIRQAIHFLESEPSRDARAASVVPDYRVPDVSAKIVRIVLSYVHYVNRVVWRTEDARGHFLA